MVDLLEAGNDLVIASRMMAGAINEEDDRVIKHRKWFGKSLSLAAKLRWSRSKSVMITDPLHGYRGCSKKFAESLSLLPRGVTADLEMVRHAYQGQLSIAEFPVQESIRIEGVTHFPAYKTGKELIKYLFKPKSP